MYAKLTDPYGNTLFSNTASSTDEGPYTLTYAGTYSLTIYSVPVPYNTTARATGAYGFTLYDTSKATLIP